jgi:23S rRNA pseudouridine1911/1915/1917 synthase
MKIDQDDFDSVEPFEEVELVYEIVDSSDAEKPRLDNFISKTLPALSRAQVQKLVDAQLVSVNGEIAKSSLRLKGGESILLRIPPTEPLDLQPEAIPLDVVFEDEYLIVVNKAPGMVTHPGAGTRSGTLVNALLHHCQGTLSGISGVERPGIVHRLDKDTSGLLVVAKEDFTHKELSKRLSEREVKRHYFALVDGIVGADSGTVDKPIGRHPSRRKEMAVVADGKHAVTHYEVVERYRNFTLLECRLETGRTHQIRVHMASLNFPVVGDLVYNRKSSGSDKARGKLGLVGQALHAAKLSFIHPRTGAALEFKAPLPADYQALLEKLRQ